MQGHKFEKAEALADSLTELVSLYKTPLRLDLFYSEGHRKLLLSAYIAKVTQIDKGSG
jgi:hypothetical protein